MKEDISKILDNCIARIMHGENLEQVLSDYPDMRNQIEPLIRTALSVSATPKVNPSPEFLNTSKTSLMRRIYRDSTAASARKTKVSPITNMLDNLRDNFTFRRRLPVAISLLLAVILVFTIGQFTFLNPSPVYASECYLRILSGNVTVQEKSSDSFETGIDGMSIETGSLVKTDEDSHALLAFFDGSTIKLDPDTTLEITRMDYWGEQSTTIFLKQWIGRTWSRVEKMIDSDSTFKIETPSATAAVHGTLFSTEVANNGSTSVSTIEGLVSVSGEDEEVFVPPNKKTDVTKGTPPASPFDIPEPLTTIVIIIDGPAAASINDPTGSSTGNLPDGLEFNQIPGSVSSIDPEGNQIITISDPEEGNYNLTLRYLSEGTANYHIRGMSGNDILFEVPGVLDTQKADGSVINFKLKSKGTDISISAVTVNKLGDVQPEKTVSPNEFKNTPPGQEKPDKSESIAEDNVKDCSSGKDKTVNEKNTGEKDSPLNEDKTNKFEIDDTAGNSPGKKKVKTTVNTTATDSSTTSNESGENGNSLKQKSDSERKDNSKNPTGSSSDDTNDVDTGKKNEKYPSARDDDSKDKDNRDEKKKDNTIE